MMRVRFQPQLGSGTGKPPLPRSRRPPPPLAGGCFVLAEPHTHVGGGWVAGEWAWECASRPMGRTGAEVCVVQTEATSHRRSCLSLLATLALIVGASPLGPAQVRSCQQKDCGFFGPILCQPLTWLTLQPSAPGRVGVPCMALTTSPAFVT